MALLGVTGLLAQEDAPNEIDYYKTLFGMEKQDIVELYITFSNPGKAESFRTIYNQYENERKVLGQRRIELVKEYISNYATLTDLHTDDLIVRIEKQTRKMDRLIFKFYKRMRSRVGSREAGQFYQVENFLLNTIRADVLEHMPFIGEFD